MIFLRLLNGQGIAGLAAALFLGLLLVLQKGDTRHWHKQSNQFQTLYRQSEAARTETVASYRQAAADAEAADHAAARQIAATQNQINQRSDHDFQARLAAARAAARRMRLEASGAPGDSGIGRTPLVPGLPAGSGGPARAASQDELPATSERARRDRGALGPEDALIATEQAIQLDELIKWVRRQAAIDPKADPQATPR